MVKPDHSMGRGLGRVGIVMMTAACFLLSLVVSPAPASDRVAVSEDVCFALPQRDLEANSCPGVRPGGIVRTPHSSYCTMNFVFKDRRGNRYIGTAGHCVIDPSASETWVKGSGPIASDFDGKRIGEFVFAHVIEAGGRPVHDFALARLDPGVPVDPEMCAFAGPVGINSDTAELAPTALNFYGHGQGISEAAPARSAVANGTPNKRTLYAFGPGMLGDSGSGVLDDRGRAVGIISTIGFMSDPGYASNAHFGTIGIMRVKPQMRMAERALGIDLELETISP